MLSLARCQPAARRFRVIMDQLIDQVNRNHRVIINKLEKVEEKIKLAKKQIVETDINCVKMNVDQEKKRLQLENEQLKVEISELINRLNLLEDKTQKIGKATTLKVTNGLISEFKTQTTVMCEEKTEAGKTAKSNANLKTEKPKKEKAESKKPQPKNEESKQVDASRLDLRVGRILKAKKHPDADTLYVEEIDCGEEQPRTVVSGLVGCVPLEEMQDRLVVVLCNLKPVKMRGITSEAMVMCACSPDKTEILVPPPGSVPGDRVVFGQFPGEPDAQLNAKKKIWEQIAPDLKTDDQCVASYKGSAFEIAGKGLIKAPSLKNVQVK